MDAASPFGSNYPIIDAEKLQTIKDLAEPGDADGFFRDLLEIFFERAPALIKDIEQAFQEGDATKLDRASHALKGTAGNLGAVSLMKLAEQLEMLGRQKSFDGASAYISELKRVYPLTRAELEGHWL